MKLSLAFLVVVMVLALTLESNGGKIYPWGVSETNSATQWQKASPDLACGYFGGPVEGLSRRCIKRLNRYRRIHKAGALQWDGDIATFAQTWADNLARKDLARTDQFVDSSGSGDGEDRVLGFPQASFPAVTCESAIDLWYSEAACYNRLYPKFNYPATSHFSQLVWKSSKRVGCGVSGHYLCCTTARKGASVPTPPFGELSFLTTGPCPQALIRPTNQTWIIFVSQI